MSKSKSTRTDRTKRAPRDPSQERLEQVAKSDGVVEEELDEYDTDKYEPAPPRE